MSGNAHQRRVFRRAKQRIWDNLPPKFNPGDTVRIVSECYGVRYERTKGMVLGKGKGYGTYMLESPKRKTPLVIHVDHLELVATLAAAVA